MEGIWQKGLDAGAQVPHFGGRRAELPQNAAAQASHPGLKLDPKLADCGPESGKGWAKAKWDENRLPTTAV